MVEEKVTIIGAGPAGMAAAIYLQRAGFSPVLLERGEPGGLLRSANWVENYPGFPDGIRGEDLASLFERQLRAVGSNVMSADVRSVTHTRGRFRIKTNKESRSSRALILATGTRPAETVLRGVEGPAGRLVFREIHWLPRSVKGRKLIIVGGGDAAFDYALGLRERGARVIIVSRSEPHCLSLLRDRTEALGIEVVVGASPSAVRRSASGLTLTCTVGKTKIELDGGLLLMACGRVPNIEILDAGLRRSARAGTRGPPETLVPGLYLAGDVIRGSERQTGIAVGDGILAAMMVADYLEGE